jgi:putative (di)nucleoside polyphosphate hydrolase
MSSKSSTSHPNDIKYSHLGYRPGVGIMLFNRDGLVFVGERIDHPGSWQMPQGGIDEGEDIIEAALREMEEEVGTREASFLAEMDDWQYYELPERLILKLWDSKYRGQKQKWLAFRFEGTDDQIDIARHKPQEFMSWRWVAIERLLDLCVPFKRGVYEEAIRQFGRFAFPPEK